MNFLRTTGWRLYWRWRSGHQLGRPRLSPEIRELIATMASANPLWGTERIRGVLARARAPQARHRGQFSLDPPLPPASPVAAAQPELAHLPCQPCSGDLGRRPLGRPDADLPDALRHLLHQSWESPACPLRGNRQSDRRLGLAAANRSHTMGPQASISDP